MCDSDIGEREIETAILNLSRNKSPGIDGLTSEFYIEFKDYMILILEKLYRNLETKDTMPLSMTMGLINIVFKKGSKEKLENYRPLTMLNNDYKILAKVLANRIKKVIQQVVRSTQAYSIPGRHFRYNT